MVRVSSFLMIFKFSFYFPSQRRAMERAQRVKKVGVRYYETHNVKNKNKNRKIPTSATVGPKSKRSKH